MLAIPLQTILHSLDFSTFVYELLRLQFSSLIAAPVSDPEYLLVGQTPQNAFDICLEQVLFGSAEVCLVFNSLINYCHHNSVLSTADCCKNNRWSSSFVILSFPNLFGNRRDVPAVCLTC